MVCRGADGELYFIPPKKLAAFRMPPGEESRVNKILNVPRITAKTRADLTREMTTFYGAELNTGETQTGDPRMYAPARRRRARA